MAMRGKVALVTGAGSGMGRLATWRLASEGVEVAAVDVDATATSDVTEGVLGYIELLVPRLGVALQSGTLPLSMASRNAAALAEDLLTELAYSYKLLLVEQSRRLFGFASSGRALLPVVRAMQMLAQRLKLGYRMYATNPKSVWLELHELYPFALLRGLAQRAPEEGGETPLARPRLLRRQRSGQVGDVRLQRRDRHEVLRRGEPDRKGEPGRAGGR